MAVEAPGKEKNVISAASQSHQAGSIPGSGTFACLTCGLSISLEAVDEIPECPRCGADEFRRASMFEVTTEQPTAEYEAGAETLPADWQEDLRASLEPGRYLAYLDDETQVRKLARGWTRIGRSVNAEVRLDDPTVSRRHAIVVWEGAERVRVLDDRSLNGVFVNGELVDWGPLHDGDELAIGRYKLYLLDV